MKIKHLFIGIALTANLFAATAQEVKKTYFVSKPGTLISMMTEEEANQVTHLTLTGKINAVDFRHLRDEFKNLQVLDIANASISMYSGKEGYGFCCQPGEHISKLCSSVGKKFR